MNIDDALAGRTGVAGLRWLLQGDEPHGALRRALARLLPDESLLGELRLYRAKSKPGRHLTAYYEVAVRDPQAGVTQRRHVEAVWLPAGSPDPRGDPADLAGMQDEARALGVSAPFAALAADDPAWGLWLQVSPLDAAYPQLARVVSPPYVRAMIESAPNLDAPPGDYAVSVVRYRPDQRHVLRYQPLGRPAADALFAKVYRSNKGVRAFSAVRHITAWLETDHAPIRPIEPAAYLPEPRVALYRTVTGQPLSQLLQTPEAAGHLRLTGAGLRALHRVPPDQVEVKPHSFEKEIASITSATEHLRTLHPAAGALVPLLLERAQALHERLPRDTPGFAYGDFKADHLWATPAGLTLIDFDTCYLFDQAIDLGKFLADLRWWYDGAGAPGVEGAQASFLAGYDPAPALLARARLYEALVLTKITARRVRLFDEDWAERTGRLLAAADGVLAALEA